MAKPGDELLDDENRRRAYAMSDGDRLVAELDGDFTSSELRHIADWLDAE